MRLLAWSAALVMTIVWAGCEWGSREPQRPAVEHDQWRRTTSGWEPSASWQAPPAARRLAVHPLALASLQMTLSLLALSTDSESPRRRT